MLVVQLLKEEDFTILIMMSIMVTALISPLLGLLIRPARSLSSYQRRTIFWSNSESELRMLVCIHTSRHVPTMIALVDAANPCKRSPILVFALQLIELTDRSSAMLVVHTTTTATTASASKETHSATSFRSVTSSSYAAGGPTDQSSFESYEQHAAGVTVHHLNAVSPYPSMHQDVCCAAEENHAAVIVLPFHKHQTIDGGMEVTNPAIRTINQNVLDSAPCSVAILVDRGLRSTVRYSAAQNAGHNVVAVFIGGPDDREALALANRMAEHPCVNLAVLRFLVAEGSPRGAVVTVSESAEEKERRLDEDCISDFRLRNAGDETVVYVEKVVSNSEETVAEIRALVDETQDLYIVGRGKGVESPLTAGLTDWSECPELGGIGDLLASSDIGMRVSVLVVQQGEVAKGMLHKDNNHNYKQLATTEAAAARESSSSNNNTRHIRPLSID